MARLVGELPGAEAPQVLDDRVVGRVPHGGAALVELVRGLDRAGHRGQRRREAPPEPGRRVPALTGRSLRDAETPAGRPCPREEVTV